MLSRLFDRRSQIEIGESSGILRVTIRPAGRWFFLLLAAAVEVAAAIMLKNVLIAAGFCGRLVIVAGSFAFLTGIAFEFFLTQIIEFNAQELVISKDFRGWERRQVYPMAECSQLEWIPNASNSEDPGLRCKVGRRTIRFAKGMSEKESVEILVALQKYLPDVAHQILAVAKSNEHFVTLGLNS